MMRPDTDALARWRRANTPAPGTADREAYDMALGAALNRIETRLRPDSIPADADSYPEHVRMAVLMQASRWLKRRDTPEGVAEFADLAAIRIGAVDADVEALIEAELRLGGFA